MTIIDFTKTPEEDFLRLLNDEYKRNNPTGQLVFTKLDLAWTFPVPYTPAAGEVANSQTTLSVVPGSLKAKGNPEVRKFYRPTFTELRNGVPFDENVADQAAAAISPTAEEIALELQTAYGEHYFDETHIGNIKGVSASDGFMTYSFDIINHLTITGSGEYRKLYPMD